MQILLILSISSFVLTLILTPWCRNLFLRWGMVDHPDGDRKIHTAPIPNMGGIPIAAAYLASFGILVFFGRTDSVSQSLLPLLLRILPPAAVVLFTGFLDDRFRLQPLQKLAAEIVGGTWAYFAGVQITSVAGFHLPGWISFVVTLGWLLACTNAFNLIDGVDGLAAGVGLFATATTLIAALMGRNIALAAATAPLLGALLGFLRYNFNPATIFLGDTGSLLIGFVLGCFGILWSQKGATILGMTAPLLALSIPILDVCLSVVRRFLRREPLFRGDRGHIHHRLLDRGFTPRRVVLTLYAACGLAAGLSVLQSVTANHYTGAVLVVFCAVAWVGIQNLGYAEFDQARRMILAGGFRRALNSQLALRAYEDAVAASENLDQCWEALQEIAQKLGFAEVSWKVGETEYHRALWKIDGNAAWRIQIPLAQSDSVLFVRASDADPFVINITALAEMMRNTIAKRSPQIAPVPASSIEQLAASVGYADAVH